MTAADPTVLLDIKQARVLQYTQVLRDHRQRHVVGSGQLADALGAVGELFEGFSTD